MMPDNSSSHESYLRDFAERTELPFGLLRSIAPCKQEMETLSLLEMMFGNDPEPTGRYKCRACHGYLTTEACDRFKSRFRRRFTFRIREEYRSVFCPRCGSGVERKSPIEVSVVDEDAIITGVEKLEDVEPPKLERFTEYKPCGCRFEQGEEELAHALDFAELQRDVDKGLFSDFEGRVGEGPDITELQT